MQLSAWFTLLSVGFVLSPDVALAQARMELARGGPQPHFVAAWAPEKEREAERSAVLAGRVSLELQDVSLNQALKALTNQAGLQITYSEAVLPQGKRVTIKAGDIAVITALTEMLFRSGLDVMVDQDGTLALVPCRHVAPRAEVQDSGTIVGIVTDKAMGSPIAGATVIVEGTRQSATTDNAGHYRVTEVEPGTYTVRARYIGYAVLASRVTVGPGQEVTADFRLVKSVQKLDELVTVTPGGMQAELRALPSPVTVITAKDIEIQRPLTFNDVFRQLVPSSVGFDVPAQPATTALSLRGANSLAGRGTVKVFVDGIESANDLANPVDPLSIDRIEVIRGPQAATTYGPDAAGGVIQIFTKRGDASARPQGTLQAEAGIQETPYDGFQSVVRQNYSASARGGSEHATYNLGANYSHLPNWLPNGDASRQSIPSVFGGLSYKQGIIAVDLSGRYLITDNGTGLNPLILQTGFPPLSQPRFFDQRSTNQTFGAGLSVTPNHWWRNRLSVGFDQSSSDGTQQRRRLTTPADTFFSISNSTNDRTFLSYNSELGWTPTAGRLSGTLTVGIDHYRLAASNTSTARAVNVDGTIALAPGSTFNVSRTVTTNTGYFAQLAIALRDKIFVTGGLRADDNSTFGADIGTSVSPRVGLTYATSLGTVDLKVRSAYGRSIRAPLPGFAFGSVSPVSITLPNPLLGPERQRGWEGGFDVVVASEATLSVTGYDQTAENLILLVPISTDPVPTDQYQNVGAVKNRGLEFEGTLAVSGQLQLRGQYAYVHSRIRDLGPAFSGDEQVGDTPSGVPTHTAGGVVTFLPWSKTAITAGVTWVGSFRQFDQIALFSCLGGTSPCPPSFDQTGSTRDFIVSYPGFAKLNATLNQQITPQVAGTVSVRNLTNNQAYEGSNILAVKGRLTSVGIQVTF
jgi:outer membrane receptor protein involved in Fe transport